MKMLVVQRTYLGKEETQAILLSVSWLTHVGKNPHRLTLSTSLSLSVGIEGLTYSITPSLTKWALDYILPHWGQMMLDSRTGADYILENLRCFLPFWNMFLQSREPTECSLDIEREFLFWTLFKIYQNLGGTFIWHQWNMFSTRLSQDFLHLLALLFQKNTALILMWEWLVSAHGVPRLFKPCLAESMEIHCCKSKQFGLGELGNMLTYLTFRCN